jgi:hypothetical protein
LNPVNVEVLDLDYNTVDEWAITGAIQGHPTLALEKARYLCTHIFGRNIKWRFVNIEYQAPNEDALADRGVIRFRAEGEKCA